MGFHVADVVTHEYIHQYHCRQRGYQHGPGYRSKRNLRYAESMQDYLGCEDEILAHAFNVASEMVVYGKEMTRTKVYRTYRRHFKDDPYILFKLSKQVVKYIKRLERSWASQQHNSTK
jgi:hypothetical protein